MLERAFKLLQSPVTVLILIVVMGVTFPMSLVASSRSADNAERLAQQADDQTQRNLEIAKQNKKNAETLRLAICAYIEPVMVQYESGAVPPSQFNTDFTAGLREAHTEIECTDTLTDRK